MNQGKDHIYISEWLGWEVQLQGKKKTTRDIQYITLRWDSALRPPFGPWNARYTFERS